MKLLVKLAMLSAVATVVNGQLEHQLMNTEQDAIETRTSKTKELNPTARQRRKTTTLKVRRMQEEVDADSPWHFDALSHTRLNAVSPDLPAAAVTSGAAIKDADDSEVNQEIDEADNEEIAIHEDVEISIIHKDIPNAASESNTNQAKKDQIQTERDLLAQLRRGPRLDYDVNRSKKGNDEFIQKVRGKVGKRISEKRGKVGKLSNQWNGWRDDDDDWWGSGKSGKGGKSGKSGKSNKGWWNDGT